MATLPSHMWGVVVRTLLRLEDDDVSTWARLSRVCGVWRAALADAPVAVIFRSQLNREKIRWLLDTRTPVIRRLEFQPDDAVTSDLLHNQLHAARLMVDVARRSGGAVRTSLAQAQNVDPAEELCRFLGLAPECYEEFHLFATGEPPEVPMLSVEAWWEVGQNMGTEEEPYDSLQALATDMQQFAERHKLAVSLSDDEVYLRVVRMQPSG